MRAAPAAPAGGPAASATGAETGPHPAGGPASSPDGADRNAPRDGETGGSRPAVAFHAPMKPPDHPRPSGDRQIARLTMSALERAGYRPVLASRLRTLETEGDPAAQAAIQRAADAEAARLIGEFRAAPPAAWLTYHCYWKAPDLLGPAVARALGIPYLVTEASVSPRRREGPWAGFAARAEAAIAAADRVFWTTARDRPALESAGHAARMTHLPAFVDAGPTVPPRPAGEPPHLLAVAMMRPGDKAESYRRLAAALAHLEGGWTLDLVGDGAASAEVLAAFAAFGDRVRHLPRAAGPEAVRPLYEAADLLVWPGVGEGVGMAWLEAQAAGLPCVAEDGPTARAVVGAGRLTPPGDPRAFAAAIRAALADRHALSAAARAHVRARHSLEAAAATLGAVLAELAG